MAYDDLSLRFTGTSGGTAITTATTGTKLGAGRFVGAERLFLARLFVPGTSANATNTLAVKFQDATTETGTYTDMGASFALFSQTATAAMGLVIDTTGTVLADDGPLFCEVRTRPLKPWVRVFVTPDGTSVQYTYAVLGVPTDRPAF